MKLAQFWYFGHVSKSLVAKSTPAMNPNPAQQRCSTLSNYCARAREADVETCVAEPHKAVRDFLNFSTKKLG